MARFVAKCQVRVQDTDEASFPFSLHLCNLSLELYCSTLLSPSAHSLVTSSLMPTCSLEVYPEFSVAKRSCYLSERQPSHFECQQQQPSSLHCCCSYTATLGQLTPTRKMRPFEQLCHCLVFLVPHQNRYSPQKPQQPYYLKTMPGFVDCDGSFPIDDSICQHSQ